MKLRAKILQAGKNACGIEIPATVVAGLGSSRRPAVKATINGYTYRSSIGSMGGKYMLSVSEDVRKHTGVAGGQTVDLTLELDTEERQVALPADFAQALERHPKAKRCFEGLSYSRKLRLVTPIDVKNPDTRRERIQTTIAALEDGRA
ncbi:MAG TPA: YdeI/OmpD-associated family protein [Candidatus Dormibacteraeota bacterium]|jgi:hypothetical protein